MKNNKFGEKSQAKLTIKRMEFYISNYLKLLEQDEKWFFRRLDYVLSSDWKKANEIEQKYLKPIDEKIYLLAKSAIEELS